VISQSIIGEEVTKKWFSLIKDEEIARGPTHELLISIKSTRILNEKTGSLYSNAVKQLEVSFLRIDDLLSSKSDLLMNFQEYLEEKGLHLYLKFGMSINSIQIILATQSGLKKSVETYSDDLVALSEKYFSNEKSFQLLSKCIGGELSTAIVQVSNLAKNEQEKVIETEVLEDDEKIVNGLAMYNNNNSSTLLQLPGRSNSSKLFALLIKAKKIVYKYLETNYLNTFVLLNASRPKNNATIDRESLSDSETCVHVNRKSKSRKKSLHGDDEYHNYSIEHTVKTTKKVDYSKTVFDLTKISVQVQAIDTNTQRGPIPQIFQGIDQSYNVKLSLNIQDEANPVYKSYVVRKSYQDFETLQKVLRARFQKAQKLYFPRKTAINLFNPTIGQSFASDLQKYLSGILSDMIMSQYSKVHEFITSDVVALDDDDPSKTSNDQTKPRDEIIAEFFDSFARQKPLTDIKKSTSQGSINDKINKLFKSVKNNLNTRRSMSNASIDSSSTKFSETEMDLLFESAFAVVETVFDLQEKEQWFKRSVMNIFKQFIRQNFGERINMVITYKVNGQTNDEIITYLIDSLTQSLWPNDAEFGSFPKPIRTEEEKIFTREQARKLFLNCPPDVIWHTLGKNTTLQGMERLFQMLQDKPVNKHLIYVLVELLLKVLFIDEK
jgi:hypothetical protein